MLQTLRDFVVACRKSIHHHYSYKSYIFTPTIYY